MGEEFHSRLSPRVHPEVSLHHLVIGKHGAIVVLSKAAHQPQKDAKVMIGMTSDARSGNVLKGRVRAASILNQYTGIGAGVEKGFNMAIILHGGTTKVALSQKANGIILITAVVLDVIVLTALLVTKVSSDPQLLAFAGVELVAIFGSKKWFLTSKNRQSESKESTAPQSA